MDIQAIVQQVMEELEKAESKRKAFNQDEKTIGGRNFIYEKQKVVRVDNPVDREVVEKARSITPARIGIGRTGTRMKTKEYLDFRIDHAAAQDAVFKGVSEEFLEKMKLPVLQSKSESMDEYLMNLDSGRRLDEASKNWVRENLSTNKQVQIIVSDGLSSTGVEAIVVAEPTPTTSQSVYKDVVAGKFVYEPFEPSVLYTLRTGQHLFHNRAITQEGKTVEQSVVPIKGENESVIGPLIMEKDISEQLQRQQKLDSLSEATEALSDILIGASERHPIIPEVIEESLFFIEDDSKILYSNSSAANMIQELGMGDCLPGDYLAHYFPEIKDILDCPEELLVKEIKFYHHIFKVKKIQLGQQNKPNGIFIIFKNITELREKEWELIENRLRFGKSIIA